MRWFRVQPVNLLYREAIVDQLMLLANMEKKREKISTMLSLTDKMTSAAGASSECDSCDSCASLPPSSPCSTSSFSTSGEIPSTSSSSSSSSPSESPDLQESQDSTESCDRSGLSLSSSARSAGSVASYEEVLPSNGTETIQTVIGGLKGWFTWANYQPQTQQKQQYSLITTPDAKKSFSATSEMTLSASLLGRSSWSSQRSYAKLSLERDPVVTEKGNLVSLLKLVIKEVIETSMMFAQQLDSDFVPVQHFLVVIEHELRHGLKNKKGFLGQKKDLWDLLQIVEKSDPEAADITASARELPSVKTSLGRSRAWLRLALMQKKICDYFNLLVNLNTEMLDNFYEPRAIMRSEEAVVVGGLLRSLNVVDCNLCLKEEDLDREDGVIDFTLYLRSNKDTLPREVSQSTEDNLSALLDQKNYIEELNRHLNITVGNLHLKVESLTSTNNTLKTDLANVQQDLHLSQEENKKLLAQIERSSFVSEPDASQTTNEMTLSSKESTNTKLRNETRKQEDLEKELKIQKNMKTEMEVAMRLMEKSVHENQGTIVTLRDQLEEVKRINLEMQSKLQECQKVLKQRADLISRLEEKSRAMAETLQKLDEKYLASESERKTYQSDYLAAKNELVGMATLALKFEKDLKGERGWRQELQEKTSTDKKEFEKLREELVYLQRIAGDYNTLRIEHLNLKRQVQENETTMVELGTQLSLSKLQVDFLQESSKVSNSASWMNDSEVDNCQLCEKEFNLSRRKHHCRSCGGIFCDRCSDNKVPLTPSSKSVRVCLSCHTKLLP